MSSDVSRFGDYVLLEQIASTTLSRVYLAREKDAPPELTSVVVLKRMSVELSLDHVLSQEFAVEMALASRLHHAKIIPCQRSGTHQNRHFLVMKYIRGTNLSAFRQAVGLKHQRIPVPVVCHIICELLEALDYAHGLRGPDHEPLNLVHRDISPQNAMVDFDGKVYLADFGIAKIAGRPIKTATGVVKGKPGYVSPEQVQMKPADRRSDLFSMGIVLWELLTNRRLFHREDELESLQDILTAEIISPSRLNWEIGAALDLVVHRALARDPERRYQSAREFHDALSAFAPPADTGRYQTYIKDTLEEAFGPQMRQRDELLRERLAQAPAPENTADPSVLLETQFTLVAGKKGGSEAAALQKVDVRSEDARPERKKRRPIIDNEKMIHDREMKTALDKAERSREMRATNKKLLLYVMVAIFVLLSPWLWFQMAGGERGQKILEELSLTKRMLLDGEAVKALNKPNENPPPSGGE